MVFIRMPVRTEYVTSPILTKETFAHMGSAAKNSSTFSAFPFSKTPQAPIIKTGPYPRGL